MGQISMFLLVFAIDSLVGGVLPALILWQILKRWSKKTKKPFWRIAVLCIVVVQLYMPLILFWNYYVPYNPWWSLQILIIPFFIQFLVYFVGSYFLFDMSLQKILIFSVIGLPLSIGFYLVAAFVKMTLWQVGLALYFNPNIP